MLQDRFPWGGAEGEGADQLALSGGICFAAVRCYPGQSLFCTWNWINIVQIPLVSRGCNICDIFCFFFFIIIIFILNIPSFLRGSRVCRFQVQTSHMVGGKDWGCRTVGCALHPEGSRKARLLGRTRWSKRLFPELFLYAVVGFSQWETHQQQLTAGVGVSTACATKLHPGQQCLDLKVEFINSRFLQHSCMPTTLSERNESLADIN